MSVLNIKDDVYSKGGVCNASNSDKKYGGMREDTLVTVQGSKPKFNPSGGKVTAKYHTKR